MKKILFLLSLLCAAPMVMAQTPFRGKVSGRVTDPTGKAVEFATVMLVKANDSTLVKGTIAGEDGTFRLENIAEGRYRVAASQVGYQKIFTAPFILNSENPTLALPVLQVVAVAKNLSEVKVTAQKPFIEQQIDKTVVNVENSPAAEGNTALEVLERVPGVTVDREGNISLKGKADVRVMIDGKPTYLSSQDLANLLRNMQANQLGTIEVMTNPPAKYDAAGNAGILNIRLKKAQNLGFNGSATMGYGYGIYGKQNAALNGNYRQKKFNVFGNYNFNHRRGWREQIITRKFREGNEITSIFDQYAENFQESHNHNLKAGLDYFLDKKTTMGVLINGSSGRWGQNGLNTTNIYEGLSTLDRQTLTDGKTSQPWQNLSTNFNFKRTLDSLGRELTADLDYAFYNNSNNQQFQIRNLGANGQPIVPTRFDLGRQLGKVDIYSAKVDYVHPFNKTLKLETGLKSSFVTTDNDMRFYVRTGNEIPAPGSIDPTRTNQFVYRENIHAAYVTLSKQFKKTGFQLGLRAEQTDARGHQITTDSVFTRSYLNLFPSMFVRHQVNKKNSMGFSYSYRIDRPDYGSLNPFLFFLDPYTFNKGNPYLKPQFTHALEVTHSFNQFLNTTINYSRTNNVMTDVLKQDDERQLTFQTRDNIGLRENVGIAVSASVPVRKWWMSINYVNLVRNRYAGPLLGADLDASFTTLNFNSQNQFTLGKKGWSAEISGFYTNGFIEGILIGRPMGQVSLGLQKQLWNKKGSLRLNVRDIFWTQVFQGSVRYQNLDVYIKSRSENRVANLTFTYRFGNMKVQAARQRQTGLEAEQRRVGGNN